MIPNPANDTRQWRLYDDHRYPTNNQSPYAHLTSNEKDAIRRLVYACMQHENHMQIFLWRMPISSLFENNLGFLAYYHVTSQQLDLFDSILETSHNDCINFVRFDLIDLDSSRLKELRMSALLCSLEYHLFETFLEPHILEEAKTARVLLRRTSSPTL